MAVIVQRISLGFLVLLLFLILAPRPASAETLFPDELLERSHEALLTCSTQATADSGVSRSVGFLVEDRGWAIIPLPVVSELTPPEFTDSRGRKRAFRKIWATDPTTGLAVVEIDYPDSPFLPLAEDPPRMWEDLLLLWRLGDRHGSEAAPLLGRYPLFRRGPGSPAFLSLGIRIEREAHSPIKTGSPVLNAEGKVVGTFMFSQVDSPVYPRRILCAPAASLRDLHKKALDAPKPLPFPLEGGTMHDAAYREYRSSPLTKARNSLPPVGEAEKVRQTRERIKQLENLAHKYPDSFWAAEELLGAHLDEFNLLMRKASQDGEPPAKALEQGQPLREKCDLIRGLARKMKTFPERNHQLEFSIRSLDLFFAGDPRPMIKLNKAELEKWGDDPCPALLSFLAMSLDSDNQPEAAAVHFKKLSEIAPDHLNTLESYQRLLIEQRNFEEEARISELIFRVEDAYQPR